MAKGRTQQAELETLLLKPIEAARVLNMSPRKLWQLTKDEVIPSVRDGMLVRYDPADLRAWIESAKTKTKAKG